MHLYSGRGGGSWYTHYGGGANPLCLHREPTFAGHDELVNTIIHTVNDDRALIYNMEYEMDDAGIPELDRSGGLTTHLHEIPCAVCGVAASR